MVAGNCCFSLGLHRMPLPAYGRPRLPCLWRMQGELAIKNQELAVATREAEKLLGEISESTALAEKEKHKVAVIVEAVSKKVRHCQLETRRDECARNGGNGEWEANWST